MGKAGKCIFKISSITNICFTFFLGFTYVITKGKTQRWKNRWHLLATSPGPQPPQSPLGQGLEQQWQRQEQEQQEEKPPTPGLKMLLRLKPWYVFFNLFYLLTIFSI